MLWCEHDDSSPLANFSHNVAFRRSSQENNRDALAVQIRARRLQRETLRRGSRAETEGLPANNNCKYRCGLLSNILKAYCRLRSTRTDVKCFSRPVSTASASMSNYVDSLLQFIGIIEAELNQSRLFKSQT